MRNRITICMACIGILLTAGIFFAAFFIREPKKQETAQSGTQIQLADITAQCQVWESRYGKENELPVDILKDLQRYVAEGKCVEALSVYRQEELICTVEELKEVCPDYGKLAEKYMQTRWGYGENLLETDKIYRLDQADGKNCFLMFYRHFDAYQENGSYLCTMLLKEGEEGWQVTNSGSSAGGVDDCEIFAREEAGQKVYYFLEAHTIGDSFAWLELSKLSENVYVPHGGWLIGLIKTGVEAEILFQETESDLTVQVREYVEENRCFLAWMRQNDMAIWGDEDEQAHYEMTGLSDSGKADNGIEQVWLIDFDGRKVSFQMKEAEDGTLVLEACAHGGDNDALLLSCRLYFIQEAGVSGCTPAYWEAFDFNGLTMRNTENAWLRDEVQKLVRKEQQQRSIVPWQGEQYLSEELFELLREEARTGFYGEENALLESYRLDFTEDMESFLQRVAETDWGNRIGSHAKDGECKWAYRWLAEDGSENYLSCINYNYAKDSIQWWKMAEGGLEEYAYVTENEEFSQLICCDGQVYYLTEAVPTYRGGEVFVFIVEIGNSDNWRSLWFSIEESSSDIRNISCITLYEEKALPPEVKEYVQEWYEEVLEACKSAGRWGFYRFSDAQEDERLTAEESRMLNSLSDGTKNQYANQYYFAADIDNDGIEEYGHAELGSDGRVTFYEKENGEFRAVPFKEVFLDHDGLTGSEVETVAIWQLWCEKLGDTIYLFTVEDLEYSPDYILRIRVLRDDYAEDKAIYLLKANMEEYCRDWNILEIRPSAEGVG